MDYTKLQQVADHDIRTTATILSKWLQHKDTERLAYLLTLYLTPKQMEELTYFYLEVDDNTKLWQGIAILNRTMSEKEIEDQFDIVFQQYQDDYPHSEKIAKLTSLFSTPRKRTNKKEY